jgi:hypothetical protein
MTEVPEKTTPNEEFTIRGDLRITANEYLVKADKAAQVICFADIEHDGKVFENILLLKLDIRGSVDTFWHVDDEFSTIVPYMKPVTNFRAYLIRQLTKFRSDSPDCDQRSASCPLWMGIGTYIQELNEFSEGHSLLTQVKASVGEMLRRMKDGRYHEYTDEFGQNVANQLLAALGATPCNRRPFLNESPVQK